MPPKSKKTQIPDNFLLIVESPSKCAKIESYLGAKYQCISSKGHIREIDGLSSINTKDRFQIEYTPIKEKRDHIETLKKTVAKYSPLNILLATDDDREGEAIAWHICQVCGLDPATTKRIVFHEITQPALLAAVNSPTLINLSLVAAQQARQVLDMVVGYKISPLLWRHLGSNRKNALSAGRCQTPALRLVYDHQQKYLESRATAVTQVHKVSAIFTNRGIKFDLDRDITSQTMLLEFLERSKTFEHRLTIGKTRPSTRAPPKPFNTSRLLQIASNTFRLSPKRTMDMCQTLYQSGLITYMRTDCQKYSEVFLNTSAEYIAEKYGTEYVGDLSDITIVDTSMPHEGIRVTNLSLSTMTSNDPMLSRLYGLIWRNTVESCMATARYNMTEYSVLAPMDAVKYKYTMETPVFLGWRRIEIKDSTLGSLTDTQALESSLAFYLEQIAKTGSPLTWSLIETNVGIDSKMTSHYTEASLINKLEDLGIGRPSTFASIVETIQERGYAKITDVAGIQQKFTEYKLRPSSQDFEKISSEKSFGDERDKLVIQPVGILVVEYLLQHFADCFSYDYTKSMEDELDVISSRASAEAQRTWHEICRKCFDDITERSKPLNKQTKQTFALADTADNILVFNTYGASIKSLSDGGFSKIRPEIELDLEKARRGEYTIAELIWREDNGCLGEYQGHPVYLKKGKFGLYAEYGSVSNKSKKEQKPQTISLTPLNKPANNIFLEDVIRLIESAKNAGHEVVGVRGFAGEISIGFTDFAYEVAEGSKSEIFRRCDAGASNENEAQRMESRKSNKPTLMDKAEASAMFLPQSVYDLEENTVANLGTNRIDKHGDKSSLRKLRSDLSIRKGKYGPYIFHQNSTMSKPKFYQLKPFKDKWESMSSLELIAAIENTYHISI